MTFGIIKKAAATSTAFARRQSFGSLKSNCKLQSKLNQFRGLDRALFFLPPPPIHSLLYIQCILAELSIKQKRLGQLYPSENPSP